MLQQNIHATVPPVPHPVVHAEADEASTVRFRSAKNGRVLAAADHLQLELFRYLEAEPVVRCFEVLAGVAVEVRHRAARVVVAALPARGGGRRDVEALKRSYEASGRRVVLVPEGRLARWPARDTCRIVADSGHAPITATERLMVLEALHDAGGETCLSDLASLLHFREDPVASVLSLVAARMIRVELRNPISVATRVFLFDPPTWIR